MERVCHARDEEFGPECGKESTRRDESGNTYCALHDYLAAISGELTFPIDATPYEMESHRAAVRALLDLLMCCDPWPVSDKMTEIPIACFATDQAKARGYDDWIIAYHEFKPTLPISEWCQLRNITTQRTKGAT